MKKLHDYEYLILDIIWRNPKKAGFFHDHDLPILERLETDGLIRFDGERWQIEAGGLYALEHELDDDMEQS